MQGRIGDRVWLDANADGIQNGSETGVAYVTADLYSSSGEWIDTTTTASDGSYAFESVAPGSYYVTFTTPPGYGFTTPNVGTNDVVDSDALSTGTTGIFTISSGADLSIDAGLVVVPTGTVRGRVWQDTDEDGIQDTGEGNVADAVVYLYDTSGGLVDVTATATDGTYEFASLKPGSYRIAFEPTAGFIDTLRDQGSNDGLDSDADSFGSTGTFTVGPGSSVTGLDAGQRPRRTLLAAGTDTGQQPIVKVFDADTGQELYNFLAYESTFMGGVRVAMGDVNGDGILDVIAAPGAGRAADVKVYSGFDRSLLFTITAFSGYTGGVTVAAGDVDGDGLDDIIVGRDSGGSDVAVFRGSNGSLLRQFSAFDSGFTGGVRVAAGDVNADGITDIVAGAGAGGTPQVRAYSGSDNSLLLNFLAFDSSFAGGVYVTAGDVNEDGAADVIVGAGSGHTPEVKVFNGLDATLVDSFLAYATSFTGGVRVGARDLDGDGIADVLTGSGAGQTPEVAFFNGIDHAEIDRFFAFSAPYSGGVFVA